MLYLKQLGVLRRIINSKKRVWLWVCAAAGWRRVATESVDVPRAESARYLCSLVPARPCPQTQKTDISRLHFAALHCGPTATSNKIDIFNISTLLKCKVQSCNIHKWQQNQIRSITKLVAYLLLLKNAAEWQILYLNTLNSMPCWIWSHKESK